MKGAEAFRGTDFEFVNAVRLRKPVFLYIIRGGRWDPDLQAVLALLLDPTINLQRARVVESEQAALVQIERDMLSVATGVKSRRMDNESSGANGLLLLDSQFFEDTIRRISRTRAESGLDAAADVARTVPILYPSRASDRLRVAYLQVLSLCANLWANHAQYLQAEQASRLAVRLAMELGDWHRMFSEIQALSGILNMGGSNRSDPLNRYGLGAALREYPALLSAYADSRASILRRRKRPAAAHASVALSIRAIEQPTPYSLAKYAGTLADKGSSEAIDRARTLMEDTVLPLARSTGQSVAYSLKEAAGVAIAGNDLSSAESFIAEALEICKERGLHHTRRRLEQQRLQAFLLSVLRKK